MLTVFRYSGILHAIQSEHFHMIYTIIKTLEETSSSLVKETILKNNANNNVLKTFFYLALEPKINFYIKKLEKSYPTGYSNDVELAMQELSALSDRKVTGNAAKDFVKNLMGCLTLETQEVIRRIILKKPQCGVSSTTVNKIWDSLVTDVPYMRCSLPKEVDFENIQWHEGVYSDLKADGMFTNVSVQSDGTVLFESRNGSPFPTEYFTKIIEALGSNLNRQFHGECVVYRSGQMLTRSISNGIMNSILKGGELDPDCEIRFFAWDTIPLEEAKPKNKYRVQYKVRRALLEDIISKIPEGSPVSLIESKMVYSYEEALSHYKEIRRRKLEGTVIKLQTMIWEDTTSKGQIKMKAEFDCELRILGFKDADPTSKNAHLFGSILMGTDDGQLEVGVTGIPDDLRAEIHQNRDSLIGAICTVTSNELLEPSKTNPKYSLFLPRLTEFDRKDKDETDTVDRIKKIIESLLED